MPAESTAKSSDRGNSRNANKRYQGTLERQLLPPFLLANLAAFLDFLPAVAAVQVRVEQAIVGFKAVGEPLFSAATLADSGAVRA